MALVEQSYFGSFPTVLDEAGRITVPRRFRDVMERHDHITWFITPGLNGNLYLYNRGQWEQVLARQQARYEAMDRETHRLFSFGYGFTLETRVDRQGRMAIPPQLRELLGLDREVVLVGVQARLELWSKSTWEAFCREMWPKYGQRATELNSAPAESGSEKGGSND